MINQNEIFEEAISQTKNTIEEFYDKALYSSFVNELSELMKEYLDDKLDNEKKVFNANCWGGGVWDKLFFYDDRFKNILCENYYETQNGRVSPQYADFPYEELNLICNNTLKKLNT